MNILKKPLLIKFVLYLIFSCSNQKQIIQAARVFHASFTTTSTSYRSRGREASLGYRREFDPRPVKATRPRCEVEDEGTIGPGARRRITALSASVFIAEVGSSIAISTPISAFSRLSTPRKSRRYDHGGFSSLDRENDLLHLVFLSVVAKIPTILNSSRI